MRKKNGEVLLAWPLTQHIITAGWLYNNGKSHGAIDLRAAVGTPVYAAEDGTVDQVQTWDGKTKSGMQSYGTMCRIKHANYAGKVLYTRYAHLSKLAVRNGQTVKEGELIGYTGNTGNSQGAHLHFEVIYGATRCNPLYWLDADFRPASAAVKLGKYVSVVPDGLPGVDTSHHQGTVDWGKVKAAGVRFALLRVGYTGTGGGRKADRCFDAYYHAAHAQGIALGAYWFGRAKNAGEAAEEAAECLSMLAGRALELPVYYDIEEDMAHLPRETAMACLWAFAGAVQAAGYRPGVYASTSVLRSPLDLAEMEGKLSIWQADTRKKPDNSIKRDIHQYGQSSMDGVSSDLVDLDMLYTPGLIQTAPAPAPEAPPVVLRDITVLQASAGDLSKVAELADSLGLKYNII